MAWFDRVRHRDPGEIGIVVVDAAIANALQHASGRPSRDMTIRTEDLPQARLSRRLALEIAFRRPALLVPADVGNACRSAPMMLIQVMATRIA